MKVGILGSGLVAKALAIGFLQQDHEVMRSEHRDSLDNPVIIGGNLCRRWLE